MKTVAFFLACALGYIFGPAPAAAAFRRQSPFSCMPYSNNVAYRTSFGYGVSAEGGYYSGSDDRNFKCPYEDDGLFPRENIVRVDVDVYDQDVESNVSAQACIQMFDVLGFGCGSGSNTGASSFTGYKRLNPGLQEWTWPGNGSNYAYLNMIVCPTCSILGYHTTAADAVSDSSWKVHPYDSALLSGWNQPAFDDSSWENALDLGAYGVAPWYKNVAGFPQPTGAHWIWHRTTSNWSEMLFRKKFVATKSSYTITLAGDNEECLFVNGVAMGYSTNWMQSRSRVFSATPGQVLTVAVCGYNYDGPAGVIVDIR
jgi:hypothetical protein